MFKLISSLALALAFAFPALAAQPVNINTADAPTLATSLRNVGETKAEAIVAYREANGAFKTADDLANVKGIGEKTVELNREFILLEGAPKPVAAKDKAG